MVKFLKNILFIVAVAVAILLAAAYYQSYFRPTEVGLLSFLGFGFVYLWVAAAAYAAFLLITNSWRAAITLAIPLCLSAGGLNDTIKVAPQKTDDLDDARAIKVMSYNLGGFTKGIKGHEKDFADACEFIRGESPDVLCLEEADDKAWYTGGKSMRRHLGYKYSLSDESEYVQGQLILSKTPFKPYETDLIAGKIASKIMCATTEIGGRDVLFVVCHLASLRLSKEEISAVGNITKNRENSRDELQITYGKMRKAFIERTGQVDTLRMIVERAGMPTIVCGDFNDIPTSYTYRQMMEAGLYDTFHSSNYHWAKTYNGNLPRLRIDYILTSKEVIVGDFRIHRSILASDHYPISAIIQIH